MGDEEPKVSYPYLRNLAGFKVNDQSMESVPHAQAELYWHVTLKFCQAFAIFGSLIGLGYGAVKKRSLMTSTLNGARNGMLLGVPVGIFTVWGRMRAYNKESAADIEYQYFDRAYRLRHHQGQVRVDRWGYIGEGVGVAAAAATGSGILGGAALGLAAGTCFAGLTNPSKNKKEGKPKVEEVKKEN